MSSIDGVSSSLMTAMNGAAASQASSAAQAQDRFMTLLVTQMKNQDPLNPLDNAQVTSQLAQLSTVTGIDKLNTTLEALQDSYRASQSLQAAGMIGHGVLVPGSAVALSGGRAALGIELAEPADQVTVTIRDAVGNPVRSMELGGQDAGTVPLAWDGRTDAGAAAADGPYNFEVAAKRSGERVPATGLAFGEVISVSTSAQGVRLNIQGIGAASLADVRQIL